MTSSAERAALRSIDSRVLVHEHRSELGSWREALCTPAPALAEHVAAMWFGEGRVTYRRDRILPRGCAHLLINLGPKQYLVDSGRRTREPFHEMWLSGVQAGYLDTESPEGVRMMGVAFSAFGAHVLTGLPQDELTDRTVDLTDVLGDGERSLRQRLLEEHSIAGRFARLERWLLARLGRGRSGHPVIRWAVDRLVSTSGTERVGSLATESGFSRKHLIELFRREIGLTPKRLARLYRFHGALADVRSEPRVSWARLAVDHGYYDQSHLIRDFKLFCGYSPERLLEVPAADEFTLVIE